jgi:hypothetical protein
MINGNTVQPSHIEMNISRTTMHLAGLGAGTKFWIFPFFFLTPFCEAAQGPSVHLKREKVSGQPLEDV